MKKLFTFKLADRTSYSEEVKTVNGKEMALIAKQVNRRGKATHYIFWLEDSEEIYYTRGRGSPVFLPIARTEEEMAKQYNRFTEDSEANQSWRNRNDYVMVI